MSVYRTQNHERGRSRLQQDVSRAASSKLSAVLVGSVSFDTGTWMQAVAQGWLVLQLSNSPFWLGVDGFMATAPGLVLTLVGGVFADLMDRRKLLIYTQVVAGLAAFTLGVLVVTQVVQVWMILSLSFVTGCCMSIAGPSYLALAFDLVGREDLANAIALNSTQFQLARALGPVFAGVGFKIFGVAGCFFANGISFAAVVIGLSMVRYDIERKPTVATDRSLKDRRAFMRDLSRRLSLRCQSSARLNAVDDFGGDEFIWCAIHFDDPGFRARHFSLRRDGLAVIMGMAGAGALFGALFLAYLGDFRRKGWFVLGRRFGICPLSHRFFAFAKPDRCR